MSFQSVIETNSSMSRSVHTPQENLQKLILRHESLIQKSKSTPSPEAFYFFAEQSAWIQAEVANLLLYQLRIGVPKSETQAIDLLQQHGHLNLADARKLKQRLEFRNLSCRDLSDVNLDEVKFQFQESIPLIEQFFAVAKALL